MENLTEKVASLTSSEMSSESSESKSEESYEGLRKIEERSYMGGTSIKYWM